MADRGRSALNRRSVLAIGASALTCGLGGCAGLLDGIESDRGNGTAKGDGPGESPADTPPAVTECDGKADSLEWTGEPSSRWSQERADAQNTNANLDATGPSLEARDPRTLKTELFSTTGRLDNLRLDHGNAFYSTANETVALDATDGSTDWSTETTGRRCTQCLHDGVLYRAHEEWLEAIDPATGCRFWWEKVATKDTRRLAASNDVLLGGTLDGDVYAVDRSDGRERWRLDRHDGLPYVALDENTAYVVTGAELWAIDVESGDVRWDTESNPDIVGRLDGPPVVGAERTFVVSDEQLLALSNADGSVVWRSPEKYLVQDSPTLGPELLYAPIEDGTLLALTRAGGSTDWHQEDLVREANSSPTLAANGLYVNEDRAIERLDPATGAVQSSFEQFSWEYGPELIITEGQAHVLLERGHAQTVIVRISA